MPIKSRMTEEQMKELSNRKLQFESELEVTRILLETTQSRVIKGTADTDTLVSVQTKVTVIEQTIGRFNSQLATLEIDLLVQKRLESKREIFKKIKPLDDQAEIVGSRFLEFYTDVESLSYARFAEMAVLLAEIDDLKAEFASYIVALIPEVNKLKHRDAPELRNEFDNLLIELQDTCKLRVLRSERMSSPIEYVTDDLHSFKLPNHSLEDWIWASIRIIREREQKKNDKPPDVEKPGFLSKILSVF